MDLLQRSIDLIKQYQTPAGAFPAAPGYLPYQYCWLRDGSFIAYALDLVGEHQAAEQFYSWCIDTLGKHLPKIDRLREIGNQGEAPRHDDFLHTRYTLKGEEGDEPWGNFQLDGYGTFLWTLAFHWKNKYLPPEVVKVVELIADYLQQYWSTPCLDCWEENGEQIHPSTLAAIYGGLENVQTLLHKDYTATLLQIKQFLLDNYNLGGHFNKFQKAEQVDANLLWLAVPFGVFKPDHPLIISTVEQIEQKLLTEGVHRYLGDSYYGGGEWILLTAWLAWYWLLREEEVKAKQLLTWVERQADQKAQLPEQVPCHLFVPDAYPQWVERWGEIANPLLWSHAMYIIVQQMYTAITS